MYAINFKAGINMKENEREIEINWTSYIGLLDCIEVPFITDEKLNNRYWYTTVQKVRGGISGPTILEGNPHLTYQDRGIYQIQISPPGKEPTGYLGKSNAVGSQTNQSGIGYRLTQHVIKLTNIPDRGQYISALRIRFPQLTDLEIHKVFQSSTFDSYRELRRFLSTEKQPLYRKERRFYEFYQETQDLEEYDEMINFFRKYVKVRFSFMKGASDKDVAEAERIAFRIYKKEHEGLIPGLNAIDVSNH